MKQWVKLDRELTNNDRGKRLRLSDGSIVGVHAVHGNKAVVITDEGGKVINNPRHGTEIEEEVQLPSDSASNLFFPSGGSIVMTHTPVVGLHPYWHWDVPNKPIPLSQRHDCYLDGHSIVETGTLRSACKHCGANASWNRAEFCWEVSHEKD